MAAAGRKTARKPAFVGFGFGPIQAGLFLLEAQRSHAFGRLVVAEVVPQIVQDVRRARGIYQVNVAHADRVEVVAVGPIDIANPADAADRAILIDAIAEAQEIATALPNTRLYATDGAASVHRILAAGLSRKVESNRDPVIIYAAENDPHAASKLQGAVLEATDPRWRDALCRQVSFVDTVIGKMSGVIAPPDALDSLTPMTPDAERAFLVEAFNRILISRPHVEESAQPLRRGLSAFIEQDDLAPFEAAKLYGHNATHALAAYLGHWLGLATMDQLASHPDLMAFLRAAMNDEAGAALIARYGGADTLFTPSGWAAYSDDLLKRMTNPHLRDQVGRVARDPARKLGWSDRLLGVMRLAHRAGIVPWRYAVGAAAALAMLDPVVTPAEYLTRLWQADQPAPDDAAAMVALIESARTQLKQGQAFFSSS